MRLMLTLLMILLLARSVLQLSYLGDCPWSEDGVDFSDELSQVLHLVSTACNTIVVSCSFCLVFGYSVTQI